MPFLVLLILALAYLQNKWPAPPDWLTPFGSVVATWMGVFLLLGVASGMVRCFRHQLLRDPRGRGRLLRRYLLCRRVHLLALIVFYFLASYLAGWGWTVKHCLTYGRWSVPGAELLILLPFLASLFLSWARFYDVELTMQHLFSGGNREKHLSPSSPNTYLEDETTPPMEPGKTRNEPFFPARWTYVGLQVRQSLILAAPPFVLLLVQQLLFGFFPQLPEDPLAMPILTGTLLALLFAGWPLLLRCLLNLKSLPDCPLRQQLEQTARRLSFRCRDILVWDTHDTLATAMLVGPLPLTRYVVLTDRLIQHMKPEEIEAVFGHEIGHVKHRHMLFYFAFFLGSLLVLSALWQAVLSQVPVQSLETFLVAYVPWAEFWQANRELVLAVPLLGFLMVYLFLVFGFLSRRCERQADMYACRMVSAPAIIAALEKTAWLNGMNRERPGWLASWRHGTIAERVNCLTRIEEDPRLAAGYQLGIGLVKWGLLITLGCLLLLVGPERLWEMLGQL